VEDSKKCYTSNKGYTIILNNLSIQEQFNSFCTHNELTNMEQAFEYFIVFGGVKISVDTNISIEKQIEEKILHKYKFLRNDISSMVRGDEQLSHAILSVLALGDRRTNSAFRKTNISFDKGINIIDNLCDSNMLSLEKTRYSLAKKEFDETVSEKLLFTTPFARFWFAFISPIFKGIRDGNFEEFTKRYEQNIAGFGQTIFEQLSHELIKLMFTEDRIVNIGKFWDNDISLDLIAKTKSGKLIVGVCKYTNNKIKKTELTKLKQKCEALDLKVDTFVLFSKKGFSSELKSLKGDDLKLYTVRNFNQFLK
jgi:hypothetical protein